METLMKKISVIFTGAEEENKADLSASRDQKAPIQKTQSFKEKKKALNWFQRQFSREMSHNYDSREMEEATAVAAAAFAINSQEVPEIFQKKKTREPSEISLTKTKSKVDGTKAPISQPGFASKRFSGTFKSANDQGSKEPISPYYTEEKKPEKFIHPAPPMKKAPTFSEEIKYIDDKKPEIPAPKRTPTFVDDIKPETPAPKVPSPPHQPVSLRPPPPPPPPSIPQTSSPVRYPTPPTAISIGKTPTRPDPAETKADVWERNQLQKIKERYEELIETIDAWERRKKMKARRQLNNKHEQSDSEQKRMEALRKYEGKCRYIDEIAMGAIEEANARRRNEELKAKEKANIIRRTGKLPGLCSCF